MTRITYEVTATVVEELRESYECYMIDRHISDLMAMGPSPRRLLVDRNKADIESVMRP